jgi:DNA-binding MarR family transcriptional regulator
MVDKLSSVELEQCAHALATSACVNLRKSSRAVTRRFDEALEPCGLRSTQLAVLLMIAAMERPTQTRIARELVAEQSTISRNLQLLKAKGLIKTTAARSSPYQTISLTPKGVERVREAIPIWERTQNAFVKKFGESRWVESLDSLSNAISSVHATTLSTD